MVCIFAQMANINLCLDMSVNMKRYIPPQLYDGATSW